MPIVARLSGVLRIDPQWGLALLAAAVLPSTGFAAPAVSPSAQPQVQPAVIPLWPEGVPLRQPNAPAEHVEDGRVYNVNEPTLTLFLPPAGTANGTAAIVCPGGGYARLAIDKEGSELQRWLSGLGVTVFILKYRVAPYQHPAPLLDVLRAVRIVRSRAAEWHVDPARIGVFGSSAGGHLAASAATLYNAPEGRTSAALDNKVSGRPDFIVLTYPVITMRPPTAHGGSRTNLIGAHPAVELMNRLSLELHVTAETPPAFIVHTQEDQSVPVENSLMFYQALRSAGVPVEMHLYEKGPHGFGMHLGLGPTSDWPKRCEDWLRFHGWLAPAPGAATATTGTIGK
jgi:acetyl esterase/lipase